jgi:transcriptional regulator with XRE-family HTH domain
MTFSERLRQQRISRGIDLAQIAAETKISKRHLEALENGDLKSIPGSIFARSFARQYARFVGVDENSIEEEIQAAFQQEDPLKIEETNPNLIPIEPVRHRSQDSFNWQQVPVPAVTLVAVLGACTLLYMGWQRLVLGKNEPSGPLAAAPALPNPFSGAPNTKLAAAESVQLPGAVPSESLEVGGQSVMELEVPQSAGPGMKISVVASQETWVSITANGKTVYTGILQPNSKRVLKGVERAKMVIGNAGGVDVLKDDQTIGPIGPQGQVRVVVLSPDGPRIMKTAKERESRRSRGDEPAQRPDPSRIAL